MSAFKYLLRNECTLFSIGTTDLKKSLGKLIDTSGCILLLVTSGRAVATINFQKRILRKGCFVLLIYDSMFSMEEISPSFTAHFISFSYDFMEVSVYKPHAIHFWDILYEMPVIYTSDEQWQLANNWWMQMEWANRIENANCREEMLKTNIRNLLMALDVEFVRNGSAALHIGMNHTWILLNRFFSLVASHYHETRDVKYYADQLAITTTYLYKLCKKNIQLSPKEVIDKQVVMGIKTYLVNTDLPVKNIASELHFEDVSYMCRYFRRLSGISPIDYRKQYK